MSFEANGGPVLLYDGVCKFCNSSVKFILKHDKKGVFRYATLDSQFAIDALKNDKPTDSGILLYKGKIYRESDVLPHVLLILGGFWKPLAWFILLFPRFIRDRVYRFIARNRYKWFGKYESCPIPKPEWKARFIN